MNILSKNTLITLFLTILVGITNNYAQSENEEISTLIEQKKAFNKKNKNSIVYKIQLYNGNEEESYKIKSDFREVFPEYNVKVVYNKPEFKTQVGNFKTRLEADKVSKIIKEEFADAIVLEDKI